MRVLLCLEPAASTAHLKLAQNVQAGCGDWATQTCSVAGKQHRKRRGLRRASESAFTQAGRRQGHKIVPSTAQSRYDTALWHLMGLRSSLLIQFAAKDATLRDLRLQGCVRPKGAGASKRRDVPSTWLYL